MFRKQIALRWLLSRVNRPFGLAVGAVLFGSVAGLARASNPPVQWTVGSGGDGNYYQRIDTTTLTYDQAVSDAAGLTFDGASGQLAVFDNSDYAAARDFVFNNVYNGPGLAGNGIYWVGVSNPDPGTGNADDQWTWLDGEVASPSIVSGWNIDYAEGGRGAREGMGFYEPSNDTLWDYIATDSNQLAVGYIVEFKTPEPATLGLIGAGAGLWLSRRRNPIGRG